MELLNNFIKQTIEFLWTNFITYNLFDKNSVLRFQVSEIGFGLLEGHSDESSTNYLRMNLAEHEGPVRTLQILGL